MCADFESRAIVIVEDDHEYKATLQGKLTEFVVYFWGCRAKECTHCGVNQPFSSAVPFIRSINAKPNSRLAAIVLDANEFRADEYSITDILPDLKSDIELAEIPVVVYSSEHLAELGGRAMHAGAAEYYDRATKTPKEAADIIRKHALP